MPLDMSHHLLKVSKTMQKENQLLRLNNISNFHLKILKLISVPTMGCQMFPQSKAKKFNQWVTHLLLIKKRQSAMVALCIKVKDQMPAAQWRQIIQAIKWM